MRTLILAALTTLALANSAQADIVCTPRGCWETHLRIHRHGGSYRYLEHTLPSRTNPAVMVKRVLRPAGDRPARSPQDMR